MITKERRIEEDLDQIPDLVHLLVHGHHLHMNTVREGKGSKGTRKTAIDPIEDMTNKNTIDDRK